MKNSLRRLLHDSVSILPHLKDQQVSLLQDLRARPSEHFNRVAQSAAVNFSLGNTLFAGYLGTAAGMDLAAIGAITLQGGITLATAGRQIAATYNGESLAAPFRIQAATNFVTAALLAGSAVAEVMQGHMQEAGMMILPTATFMAWGNGHWQAARYLDELSALQSTGAHEEEIANNPTIQKFETRYLAAYGGADIVAPWKNMSPTEVAETVKLAVSTPSALNPGQAGALLTLPFFISGLAKTFAKVGSKTHRIFGDFERTVNRALPSRMHRFFGTSKKGPNPNHYYSTGYGVGAGFALVSGTPLFAAAQAFWSKAYLHIAKDNLGRPQDADTYAAQKKAYTAPLAL